MTSKPKDLATTEKKTNTFRFYLPIFIPFFCFSFKKTLALPTCTSGVDNRRDVATKVTFDKQNPPLKAPTPLSSAKLVSKGSCCLSAAGTSSFGFQTKW